MNKKSNPYPCPAPFSQLYVVPRTKLDLRFCSYHEPILVDEQESYYLGGSSPLENFFQTNEELRQRRDAYLAGNYEKGAGCSRDCYWYARWRTTGEGFSDADYRNEEGEFALKKIWLSIGPDCNIFCRYCLDPEEFVVDYNTCDKRILEFARDFIVDGGEVLLTGGEPFLPKFKLSSILEALCDRPEIEGSIEIHTNGTFLNAKNRDLVLRSPVSSLDVSMDTFRSDLFEYLRKGAKFDTVWGNTTALVNERNQRGLNKPHVTILCAVMVANHDHLEETVEIALDAGLRISINSLFKGYYSPDFCREQGLHNLTMTDLEGLSEKLEILETKHAKSGMLLSQGFKGQLNNLIDEKKRGHTGAQVTLGHGGEAPRKASLLALLERRKYRAVAAELPRRIVRRIKSLTR